MDKNKATELTKITKDIIKLGDGNVETSLGLIVEMLFVVMETASGGFKEKNG